VPIEALSQTVETPLWLLLLLAAYTPERLARMAEAAPRLRRQSEPQEAAAADEAK
jgi:hypothetical protein